MYNHHQIPSRINDANTIRGATTLNQPLNHARALYASPL
jgi:hypothetical protein